MKTLSLRWKSIFSSGLNLKVCALDGDNASNLKLFESNDIVVSSVENFYPLSKRWKQRKSLQDVGFYIFDDLHYINDINGHVYEALVSRLRYASSQMEITPRIFGLTASLANAREVGEWIGAPSFAIYNFPPSARPFPVETQFVNFDSHDYKSRLQSMMRTAFNIVKGTRHSVVVVNASIQAKLFSIDYSLHLQSSQGPGNLSSEMAKFTSELQDLTLLNIVPYGIAYLNDSVSEKDFETVKRLYDEGIVTVVFVPFSYNLLFEFRTSNVVLLDTVNAEDNGNLIDYNVYHLLNILNVLSPGDLDGVKLYLLIHPSKKAFLRKVLLEPIPIESQLHQYFHDHLNVEIALKSIENKQHAIDFLTWSFLYRRLAMNPNYYNMSGTSHQHLSDFLSDLIENVTSDLESSQCISVENDVELRSLNLGMIANYYDIGYTTIDLFSSSLTQKTKSKGIIEIVSASPEFSKMYVRDDELHEVDDILATVSVQINETATEHVKKVQALLHAHLHRKKMTSSLFEDLRFVLNTCLKYTSAMVDIISSQGWLKPAIATMELSQMITQGLRTQDSLLLQIPHFDSEIVEKMSKIDQPVESIFDFIDLDDTLKTNILQFSQENLSDVALFCNAYPVVELNYDISSEEVRECLLDCILILLFSQFLYLSLSGFMPGIVQYLS
jgi:pre-mRNA-splicing helicase BRR2